MEGFSIAGSRAATLASDLSGTIRRISPKNWSITHSTRWDGADPGRKDGSIRSGLIQDGQHTRGLSERV